VQEGEGFRWKANIQVLRNSITELSSNPLVVEDRYDRPTLFIRGGKSGYLRSEHIPEAKQYFPHSQFEVLPHAGHDVHVEDRPGFLAAFQNFLFSA
ncbi:MAG: alpha/beta hydrolase, partial [Opitutae bacterium]|nr:alpha/beta hydrolase [Opitutae bacterium]